MKRLVFAICIVATISLANPAVAFADKSQNALKPQAESSLEFPAGASTSRVPVRTLNGTVVVRVQIGTHNLDFAFDSGAGVTAVNADVLKSLGLTSDPNPKSAVTSVQVGDVKLNDVTVYASSLQFQPFEDTKIVGLIGYDLLKDAVVRLDYVQGTLDITKPDGYAPPASAIAIPLHGPAAVPVVTASMGRASGDRFVVDTGAYTIVVFPSFTNAHPELFNDAARRHDLGGNTFVSRLQPICGVEAVVPYSVPDFRLGEVDLPNWLVLAHQKTGCFNPGGSPDGLIGFDFLRLFTITFDMPASRIYLEPREPR